MEKQLETHVLVIGAGTTGTAIARELSKYKVDTILVEKNEDVCRGEAKASHGNIYPAIGIPGADSLVLKSVVTPEVPISRLFHPVSLKTKFTNEGFNAFPALAEELEIDFAMARGLPLAKDDDDIKALRILEEICKSTGVEPHWLDKEGIRAIEPNINKDIIAGLIGEPDDFAYVYPWEYAIALAENALKNGVRIMLLAEVRGITPLDGGFIVDTTRGPIRTEFIINAAGAYADKIAQMAGVCDFGLTYMSSQMLITDKRLDGLVKNVTHIALRPGVNSLVRGTHSGNLLIVCGEYYETDDPEGTSTRMEWTRENIIGAQQLFLDISPGDIINSYTGVRVFNTRDPEEHLFEVSSGNAHFLNAVTRLPGLTITPAASKYLVGLLADQGLEVVTKTDFDPRRKRIPRVGKLADEERRKLIAQDPRYGHIVCRCEEVSEGEIVEAIRRGARSVTGVKYRTRAGMGRCHGGFCGPRVVEILARELDMPVTQVNYKGGLSRLLLYRSKELLGVE